MAVNTTTNNGGEDEYEWEGGPIEEESAPSINPAEMEEMLQSLESEDGFEQPEVADEGVSPTAPFEEPLEQALQTLEADQPFEQPPQSSIGDLELPTESPQGVDVSIPDDDIEAPPPTLQGFYESGGKFDGSVGSLPGFDRPQEDPTQGIQTYLHSGLAASRAQSDMLIDHGSQLDHITESIGRARL